ncbi:MAG: YggT family protein, partial [Rhodospirillales bacterium]|nr:YggT family protein [Rhodospirillales bacterium]
MDIILIPLFKLIYVIIDLFIWALIISAVLSWLMAFGVVNTHNRFVYSLRDILWRVTEPALRPIRRFVPDMGGVDLSPLVLILILWFAQEVLLML